MGAKVGQGNFELRIDGRSAGVLVEDALLFAPKSGEGESSKPSAFMGEVIYHQIEPSPGEGAREFLEIRKATPTVNPLGSL